MRAALFSERTMTFIKKIIGLSVLYLVPQKVFKRIMYMQIDTFTGDKLTKLLAVFRKNHNTQHCLMSMLEMYKNTLEKGGYASFIFMELSNASDTLNRKLINKLNRLITKLGGYRYERDSLS